MSESEQTLEFSKTHDWDFRSTKNNVVFNRFRLSRPDYPVELKELQIWIKDDVNDIQNIAPLFTTINTNDPNGHGDRPPNFVINEIITDIWHGIDETNRYASFTSSNYYDVNDLQCIVLYGTRSGYNSRIENVKIELMNA